MPYRGGVMDLAFPDSEYRRGRVINNGQTTNTLDTGCNIGLNVDDYRIRKLTPKECFRLQGFPDEYFERAKYLFFVLLFCFLDKSVYLCSRND